MRVGPKMDNQGVSLQGVSKIGGSHYRVGPQSRGPATGWVHNQGVLLLRGSTFILFYGFQRCHWGRFNDANYFFIWLLYLTRAVWRGKKIANG